MAKTLVKRCARRSSNSLSHKRKTQVIGTERMAPHRSLHVQWDVMRSKNDRWLSWLMEVHLRLFFANMIGATLPMGYRLWCLYYWVWAGLNDWYLTDTLPQSSNSKWGFENHGKPSPATCDAPNAAPKPQCKTERFSLAQRHGSIAQKFMKLLRGWGCPKRIDLIGLQGSNWFPIPKFDNGFECQFPNVAI